MVRTGLLILLLTSLVFGTGCQKTSPVWLDDLKIPDFSESIASTNVIKEASRDSILIGEAGFKRGLGVRAVSVIPFLLDGKAKKLTASVGMQIHPPSATLYCS